MPKKQLPFRERKSALEKELFIRRAARLIQRLDAHCRDEGLHAYLKEMDTWNHDYASDVKILMGEAFEIMRLKNYLEEKGLTVPH